MTSGASHSYYHRLQIIHIERFLATFKPLLRKFGKKKARHREVNGRVNRGSKLTERPGRVRLAESRRFRGPKPVA